MSGDKLGEFQPIGYIPMAGANAKPEQATGDVDAQPSVVPPAPAPTVQRPLADSAPARPPVRMGRLSHVSAYASVCGDVALGDEVFVAPMVSIRGDSGAPIRIGNQSNVQDGAVIHCVEGRTFTFNNQRFAVWVGDRVSLAHRCLIHGPCVVQNDAFIGFGAMVINANVGEGAVVMHMAYVSDVDIPAGRLVPAGTVVDTPDQARALPKVPASLRQFADGVIQQNRRFARNHAEGNYP